MTRNSTILEWRSNQHIGTDGDDIQIYGVGNRVNVTSVTIPTTYATRVSVTMENPGITVIVSQLFITASDRFPISSVTCGINGLGPRKTITFNTIGMSACILNSDFYGLLLSQEFTCYMEVIINIASKII